jgi:hypothetical protein
MFGAPNIDYGVSSCVAAKTRCTRKPPMKRQKGKWAHSWWRTPGDDTGGIACESPPPLAAFRTAAGGRYASSTSAARRALNARTRRETSGLTRKRSPTLHRIREGTRARPRTRSACASRAVFPQGCRNTRIVACGADGGTAIAPYGWTASWTVRPAIHGQLRCSHRRAVHELEFHAQGAPNAGRDAVCAAELHHVERLRSVLRDPGRRPVRACLQAASRDDLYLEMQGLR